jgi:DHA2 family multidrug resistance protein
MTASASPSGGALAPQAAAPGPADRPAYFTTGWTGGRNPWAIALVVTMATFMEVLDTSIANVSLPHIAGNLSVSQDESTWVLTSYLVSNAIVLPISGWIASKLGRKRFYMMCVAMFTISSFLCGMAPNLGFLIFCRVLQGLGGGGLGPSEQSILADTFPPAKRGMAFAVYGMAVVLAPAIGPTLGGFITDHYNWRWVFFINVPVGIASLFLSNHFVTDPPHLKLMKERAGGIDYIGLSLIALGLGTLEVVLDKGQEDDWFHTPFIVWFSIIAAASLVSFVVWEWNHAHPVVDVRLFKSRNFATSNAMMLALGISLFGTTVLLPQYTQVLMGYSAQQAGMALSPGGFVVILLLPLVGTLVSKVDARYLIAVGFTVLSASMFYMTTHLYQGIDFKTAVLLRVYQSVGIAFLFVPINSLVYSGVPLEKNNAVSGIVNLSRNMGGDVGIAFVTTFIARRAQKHQMDLSSHTTHYSAAFEAKLNGMAAAIQHTGTSAADAMHRASAALYGQLVQQSMTLAYIDALKVLAIGTAFMVPLLAFTQKPKTGAAPAAH